MTEPRHIAAAVAELGHATLTRAWHYLLDTHAGVRAHVPGDIRRKGLLVPAASRLIEPAAELETDALACAREWTSKGIGGVMVGPVGCGKSHAAFAWLMHFARAGHSCRWTQAGLWRPTKSHDAEVEACKGAHALVIDDIGASNMSGWHLAEINSITCWRLDRSMPTIIAANLDRFALKDGVWPLLDDRTASRVLGRVRYPGGECLRTDEVELDDLDREGRGRAWTRANTLIEIFGVEADGVGVEPGHREARRDRVDFGSRLTIRLAVALRQGGRQAAAAEAREACRRAGVDVDAARARAQQIAASPGDIAARAAVDAALAKLAASTPRPAAPKRARVDLDERLAHEREVEARLDALRNAEPREVRAERLKGLGVTIEQRSDGWEVRHNGRPLAVQIDTQEAAWAFARKAMQPT